ncbi:hypothetical protein [Shimazuella alba]|uniref:Uncharacterized protein n=1 Tax=Shimazuella alba TaxID=2690964 RepID=A0A6I4W0N9_9BACL|nr:hypothetical protein [Shimazuella alba]MXQ55546.1 hypothetical protein [Shimazuella alba]
MARKNKSGEKIKLTLRQKIWRVIKWILIATVTLSAIAFALCLFLASQQSEDDIEPKKPAKQYMVEEKETWYDADMPAPTQETGDEKGEEVKVDPNPNVWK